MLARALNRVVSEFSGPTPGGGVHFDAEIVCFGDVLTVESEDCGQTATLLNEMVYEYKYGSFADMCEVNDGEGSLDNQQTHY